MLFAKNLERAMMERGVNAPELAERIGVSRQTVNNWMSTKTFPRAENLDQVESVLQRPIAWFFADDSALKSTREVEDVKAALGHIKVAVEHLESSLKEIPGDS